MEGETSEIPEQLEETIKKISSRSTTVEFDTADSGRRYRFKYSGGCIHAHLLDEAPFELVGFGKRWFALAPDPSAEE